MSNELQPIVVDLNASRNGTLNESWLAMFGGAIQLLLKSMFGGDNSPASLRTSIRGTPEQVAAFGDVLGKEKRYMETFLKHGLNDPASFKSKATLNTAVANFERETGIKWPFK